MKERRLAALLLVLALSMSAAGAAEGPVPDGAAEAEASETEEETTDLPGSEAADLEDTGRAEDGAALEAPDPVPVPEEEAPEVFTLTDLLAVLPEEAAALLDASALEGAPEYGRCWEALTALIGRETAEQMETEQTEDAPPEEATQPEETLPLAALDADTKRYIALRLLAFAQENGLLEDLGAARDCAEGLVDAMAAEHSPYTAGELARLNAVSERFSTCGKLAAGVSADRLILRGGGTRLQYAPIAYNGRLLLAVEDLAELLGGTVVLQEQGDGLAVQAGAVLIELEKGSATAFLNDGQIGLSVPVLVFEGRIYVSAEALLLTGEREGVAFAGVPCLICER